MKSIRRTARAARRGPGRAGRATLLGLESLEPRCMFNAAPVAGVVADLSAPEDSAPWNVDLSAAFSDPDGDALTYSLVGVSGSSLFSNIQLNSQTGQLVLPPAAHANGSAQLTFRATDASGAFADVSFWATLTAVNDAPYIGAPSSVDVGRNGYFSIPVGNCVSIFVGDVDASTLEVSMSATNGSLVGSLPGGLSVLTGALGTGSITVSGSAGSINTLLAGLRFVPTPDYVGSASFSLFVTDHGQSGSGGVLTASHTMTLNVVDYTNDDDTPVAVNDQYCLTEDVTLTIPVDSGVLRNDARQLGDVLGLQLVDDVSHGELTLNADGSFSYTPDANYFGADYFTYLVTGEFGDGTIGRVDLNVRNVNDAPTANGDSYSVDEDQVLTVSAALGLRANDVDVDFDALSTYVQSGPSHGQLSLNTNGSFTYTPNANYFGADSFTYRVYDPFGASSLGTVQIVVNSVNDLPTAVDDFAETNPGQSATIDLVANDSDLETPISGLVWEVVSGPALGAVTMDGDGKAVYTPAVGQTTDVTFTYRVGDADGGWSSPATASIHLNVAPTAIPPVETPLANDGGLLSLPLAPLFSDPEGQGLSYSLGGSLPAAITGVSIDPDTGVLSFTPAADVYGTFWVTVVAVDPLGLTQTTLLPITLLEATPHDDLASALDLGTLPIDLAPTPITQNGLLNDHRGRSYYRFTLDSAAVIDFAVAAERLGSDLDARLTLYRADGTKLAASNDANGLDPEIRKELAAGEYYLVVEAEGFHTGTFQLVGQATPAGQTAPPLALPEVDPSVLEKAASLLQAATSSVQYLTDVGGALIGVKITIGLTQPLDALRALLPQAYSLIGAGADGVFHTVDDVIADGSLSNAILSMLDLEPGISQTLTVTAALSPTTQAGEYVFTWRPGLLTTLGGSVLSSVGLGAADVLASFTFRADPPTVVSTTAAAFFELDAPNRIVVQYANLSDSAVQPGSAAAGLPATYQLERRTATGWEALAVTSVSYTPLNQQAVLAGFGSLAAGEYRLTILADGLTNARGLELDGDANGAAGGDFVQTFTVAAPTGTVDRPNAALLDGTTALLENTRQFLDAAVQAGGKGLAGVTNAASLLQAALGAILAGGTADAIQAAVSAAFSARLAALAIPPNEYMVVWSLDARFLLKALEDAGLPADQQRIVGRDGSGLSFSATGAGGVYLSLSLPAGAQTVDLAIAIVPLDSHQDFFSKPGLSRADGGSSTPDLRWSLETSGGGALASVGVLFFGNNGFAGGSVQTNLGSASVGSTLTPPPVVTGFDTQTGAMGQVLAAAIQTLAGDLSQRSTPTLILWFDPVDFVLEDASGGQAGSAPGGPTTQPQNSYYSGNGSTELLVIAGAKEDAYKLALTGLDSGYRGGIDYWSGAARQSYEYQGTLPSSEGVAALLDFRRAAPDAFDFASFGANTQQFLVFNPATSAGGFSSYSIPSLLAAVQGVVGGLGVPEGPGPISIAGAGGLEAAAERLMRLLDDALASLSSERGGLATSLEAAVLAARMRVNGWWARFRNGASRAASAIPGPVGWGVAVDAAFSWFESQAENAESEVRGWLGPTGSPTPAASSTAPVAPRSDAGSARYDAPSDSDSDAEEAADRAFAQSFSAADAVVATLRR